MQRSAKVDSPVSNVRLHAGIVEQECLDGCWGEAPAGQRLARNAISVAIEIMGVPWFMAFVEPLGCALATKIRAVLVIGWLSRAGVLPLPRRDEHLPKIPAPNSDLDHGPPKRYSPGSLTRQDEAPF